MYTTDTVFRPIISFVGDSIQLHKELKLNKKQLTITERDLQVAPNEYRYLNPLDLLFDNYTHFLTSNIKEMDFAKPFIAIDNQNTVYLYIPA